MSDPRSTFGELLGALRTARGWSQGKLAAQSNLDPSTVSRLEAGTRAPERETVMRLADALVLPLADRDRLLASAGFRSAAWEDPMMAELALLMVDPTLPAEAVEDLRALVRVAIHYARAAREAKNG